MNLDKKLLYGAVAVLIAAHGIAWAATQTLTLGASGGPGGILTLFGSTSGSVTVQTAAAAGTGTVFQLPASNGTNGYVLQTNGSGVTDWVTSGGFTPTWTASSTNPTLTCDGGGTLASTGTIETVTANKVTFITVDLTLPGSVAGCSGNVLIPLPNTTRANSVAIMGREAATTGHGISLFNSGSVTSLKCAEQVSELYTHDCITINYRIVASGVYGNT